MKITGTEEEGELSVELEEDKKEEKNEGLNPVRVFGKATAINANTSSD